MSPLPMVNNMAPGDPLAAEINLLHEAAEQHATLAVVYAARCGEKLLHAKAVLGHGQWLPWLAEHCHVKERQARKYMTLASEMPELLEPNRHSSADLLGINHAIALLTADEEIKAEVQARIDAGESVTVKEIEALKREAQQERETRQLLAKKLEQAHRQNQTLDLNLQAASEREQRTYKELLETQNQITAIADEQSRSAIEQAQQEAQAAQQRIDDLRQQLERLEREKKTAIREGIKSGMAQRQEELNQLERDIQYAEASLKDYRQRLQERTGDEHENQRLNIDAEKALRELMVLGTTLNMFEAAVIYTVNQELLERIKLSANAVVPLIEEFQHNHRRQEKPVSVTAAID